MIYLSSLMVDTGMNPDRPRPGRLWLRNIYHVHQRLSMAFPSRELQTSDPHFLLPYDPNRFQRPKFLFRIDRGVFDRAMRTMIIVQSEIKPDWKYAFQNAPGLLAASQLMRTYAWTGNAGDRVRFRLLANPTRKRKAENRKNGRRIGLFTDEDCRNWLARKSEMNGFSVDSSSLQIQTSGFRQGCKLQYDRLDIPNQHDLKFTAVQFDGLLNVTDDMKFAGALRNGIGSGKAFGFGLLSIAPLSN